MRHGGGGGGGEGRIPICKVYRLNVPWDRVSFLVL